MCIGDWVPITPYKRQWQAIRGMWGKRAAAKVLEEEPFTDSLVGKPFTFTDLSCVYPWCQVTALVNGCFNLAHNIFHHLIHIPPELGVIEIRQESLS